MDYLKELDPRSGSSTPLVHFLHFFPTKDNEKYGSYRYGLKGVRISDLIHDSNIVEFECGDPNWIPIFIDLDKYLIQKGITVDEIDRQRKMYHDTPENESLEQRAQREGDVFEFFKPILQHLVEERKHDPEILFA